MLSFILSSFVLKKGHFVIFLVHSLEAYEEGKKKYKEDFHQSLGLVQVRQIGREIDNYPIYSIIPFHLCFSSLFFFFPDLFYLYIFLFILLLFPVFPFFSFLVYTFFHFFFLLFSLSSFSVFLFIHFFHLFFYYSPFFFSFLLFLFCYLYIFKIYSFIIPCLLFSFLLFLLSIHFFIYSFNIPCLLSSFFQFFFLLSIHFFIYSFIIPCVDAPLLIDSPFIDSCHHFLLLVTSRDLSKTRIYGDETGGITAGRIRVDRITVISCWIILLLTLDEGDLTLLFNALSLSFVNAFYEC